MSKSLRSILLLAVVASTVAAEVDAQVRRGRAPDTGPRWAPVSVGVAFGWDQRANGEVIGAQLRIPVVRSGIFELLPNAQVIYPSQTREYQYNLEATYLPGGIRGGLFLGGGVGWRSTLLAQPAPGLPRETIFGYTVVVGGKTRIGRVELEAALRWIFLQDTSYRPNAATLGINLPLWVVAPGR